jgi:hypothetical protein
VNYRQLKQAASETRHEPVPYLSVSRADPARKIVSTLDGFDFTARPIRANRIPKFQRARPAPESNQRFKGCVFWTCWERKSQDSSRGGRRFPCRLKPDSPHAAKTHGPWASRMLMNASTFTCFEPEPMSVQISKFNIAPPAASAAWARKARMSCPDLSP